MPNLQDGLNIKNLSQTTLHKVYAVSSHTVTHKMDQFYKVVWGMSLRLHLLTVIDSVVTVAFLIDTMLAFLLPAVVQIFIFIFCKLL